MRNNDWIIFDLFYKFLLHIPSEFNKHITNHDEATAIIKEFMEKNNLIDDEYHRPAPKNQYDMKVEIISRNKGKPVSYE